MTTGRQIALHLAMLIALCGALYFPHLGAIPFFDKGEPREALAVQDIVQRGEWLVPLKLDTVPSKPPLMHWSAAVAAKLSGALTEATIRLPSALYATLGVLLVYWLGRQMFDGKTALFGAAILATTMVYQDQALSARVDMTMCFFVTASLVLFHALYRGYLNRPWWFYGFYVVVGVGTLAKGPLGLLLPALVAASLALVERRWDMIRKFCFHPGVALTLVLATAWYVVAITLGGEGFFDRQILEENLSRFAGGSGHSQPVYYYLPYLFALGMPWGIFLPLLLWDVVAKPLKAGGDRLILKLWFLVMFVFFSLSMGKRPVYLLPVYPALSLMLAAWFSETGHEGRGRIFICRGIAVLAALTGIILAIFALGALWSHDQGWFFAPIEELLRPKDRANLLAVRSRLDDVGWAFTIMVLVGAGLWLSLARFLWVGRLRMVGYQLILVALVYSFLGWTVVMPAIAHSKSYREFMVKVNGIVQPDEKLALYGPLNSDSLMFYRGSAIDWLDQPADLVGSQDGSANAYLIMPVQSLKDFQRREGPPSPLLESAGTGPEGDARLVLVRAVLR
jgi:4-amino-4-deoxy-L-arabinose transferase-like glycosyltransferase